MEQTSFVEVRVFDRNGDPLPDNALSSEGELYAEVAKMQRLRSLAWKLEEQAFDTYRHRDAEFRAQMSKRAEARTLEAYDRYTERSKGITICTVTRSSQFAEGYARWETIE